MECNKMKKTKEELTVLKNEFEALRKKLSELTEDELKAIRGGDSFLFFDNCPNGVGCTANPSECKLNRRNNPHSTYLCDKD